MKTGIVKGGWFPGAVAWVLAVSVLDYLTGYYLRLWPLNLAAAAFAAWRCGLGESLFLAVLAGLCNIPVELGLIENGSVWGPVWNIVSKTAIMAWTGYVFHRLRLAMGSREEAIADLNAAKNSLERSEALLNKSQALASLGSFEWDGTGDAMAWSRELYRLLEVGPGERPGLALMLSRFGEKDGERFRELLAKAGRSQEAACGDFATRNDGGGGASRILQARIEGLGPESPGGVAGALQDITQRRRLEELRDHVERVAQHDLRSPLSGVVNIPRILAEEGNLTPRQLELLGALGEAGENMLRMINLSLDIHRMERGVFVLEPFPVDLNALAQRVARHQYALARARKVGLTVLASGRPAAESGPLTVPANETLCYSMLSNLVRNALEAAPEGTKVVIDLRPEPGFAAVDIHNQGVLPPGAHDRLFEKYVTAGKTGGLGLGTYSARLIARAHGGDVTAASDPEKGVTFTACLPVSRADGKTAAA